MDDRLLVNLEYCLIMCTRLNQSLLSLKIISKRTKSNAQSVGGVLISEKKKQILFRFFVQRVRLPEDTP